MKYYLDDQYAFDNYPPIHTYIYIYINYVFLIHIELKFCHSELVRFHDTWLYIA